MKSGRGPKVGDELCAGTLARRIRIPAGPRWTAVTCRGSSSTASAACPRTSAPLLPDGPLARRPLLPVRRLPRSRSSASRSATPGSRGPTLEEADTRSGVGAALPWPSVWESTDGWRRKSWIHETCEQEREVGDERPWARGGVRRFFFF